MAHDRSREYLIDNRHNNSRRQNEQATNVRPVATPLIHDMLQLSAMV
jgi:hypothetical protein